MSAAARPSALEGVLETALYHEPEEAEEMLRLYRDVLGMPVVASWEDGTALRVGAGLILLFDRERLAGRGGPIAGHGTRGPSHLALLASARGLRDLARGPPSRGGRDRPRAGVERSARRSFYFRDPGGNLIEIAGGDIWPPAPAGSAE